jgi:predicted phage terminase large subunit-like protein
VTGRVRVYIPSRLEDNPALTTGDPGYGDRLKGTGPSWLVAAWRKGDWYATQEGGVIKSRWWGRYEVPDPFAHPLVWQAYLPPDRIVAWVHSWDTAQKTDELNDYTAGTVWAVGESGRAYLVDVFRKKVEFPGLRTAVMAMADKWPCDKVLIEDKASGTSLIQDLRNSTQLPVFAVEPDGAKAMRALSSTLLMEAGRMVIPHRAPWLQPGPDMAAVLPADPGPPGGQPGHAPGADPEREPWAAPGRATCCGFPHPDNRTSTR